MECRTKTHNPSLFHRFLVSGDYFADEDGVRFTGFNYLMNPAQALLIAQGNEQRAHDFYRGISRESPSAAVRAMAGEFADEEQEHLALLEEWMANIPHSPDEEIFDPDPPHMPE